MTNIFISRPELLPQGETLEDHKKWQQEEAKAVEQDRKTSHSSRGGLFKGFFKLTFRRNIPAIRDLQDGVSRCPRCTWELEAGICPYCSLEVQDRWHGSDSVTPALSHVSDDDELIQYMMETGDIFEAPDRTSEESDTYNFTSDEGMQENRSNNTRGRVAARGRRSTDRYDSFSPAYSPANGHYSGSDITDNEINITTDYSSDDDTGSLADFVVEDVDGEGTLLSTSSRRDSQEIDHVPEGRNTASGGSEGELDADNGGVTSEGSRSSRSSHIDQYDGSYQSPIPRHILRERQSSNFSPRSTSHRTMNASSHQRLQGSHPRGLRQNDWRRASNRHSQISTNPRGSGQRNKARREVNNQVDSDSDSPPMRLSLRRRRIATNRVLSDDEDVGEGNEDTITNRQNSNGVGYTRKDSVSSSHMEDDNLQSANQIKDLLSSVSVDSSPVEPSARVNGWSSRHESMNSSDDDPVPLRTLIARNPKRSGVHTSQRRRPSGLRS